MSIKIFKDIKNNVLKAMTNLTTVINKISEHNLDSEAHKTIIPTKTSSLINDSDFVSDANYVHTDNNFTAALLANLKNQSGTNTGDETNSSIISKLGFIPANSTISPTISSGSGTPTSIPAKVGNIYIDTTNYKTYISKGTTSSSDWIKQNGSYTITAATVSTLAAPLDATTYYFGALYGGSGLTTYATNQVINIPRSGVITRVNGGFYCAPGSSETSNLYIRVNNTTDYLISSSIVNNGFQNWFGPTSLSIPVSAGDNIVFKWITPTWATNPANMNAYAQILIDL